MTKSREYWTGLLKRFIRSGVAGIYIELSYHQFNKIQQLVTRTDRRKANRQHLAKLPQEKIKKKKKISNKLNKNRGELTKGNYYKNEPIVDIVSKADPTKSVFHQFGVSQNDKLII